MDDPEISYFATTNHRGQAVPFGIRNADRRNHFYIVGKTGTGKSTLLRNLIIQDMRAGRGVGLIDPHGDLAQELLEHVPRARTDETIYFDPADLEWPVGFNPMAGVSRERRPQVASAVVSAFKNIWSDSWGPRLEYILYNAIAALLDHPEATLLGIPRILVDERFRDRIVRRVQDPVIRAFWELEFEAYEPRFRAEAIAPVQNKIGKLLASAPLRNILGQVSGRLRPRELMDCGGILIANLSKGAIGEDKAHLIGALLVSAFQTGALDRSDFPEESRRDFFLHIDEFHNFTTNAFATALAEARKYRLCLSLAHQYLEQMTEETQSAVFGNVGTLVSFRVGTRDAALLFREFQPRFSSNDLIGLDRHRLYVKLCIDGSTSPPFSASAMPPFKTHSESRAENIRNQTRRKHARPRHFIESHITKWLAT